jgi:hypothetical protein
MMLKPIRADGEMVGIEEAHVALRQRLGGLRPCSVGTAGFPLSGHALSDPDAPGGVILQVAHGAHVLHIEREATPRVGFYHWSPGTGSRCASIDVTVMEGSSNVQIAISWCPQEIQLRVMPTGQPQGSARWAKGVPSQRQFRVTRSGDIVQIGDHGVEVLQPTIFENDTLVLEPAAIESWHGVIRSADVLLSGQSESGYMFDVVQCNSIIVGLVTGFEWYCRKRFAELEEEGSIPDVKDLIEIASLRIPSVDELDNEAKQSGMSLTRYLVDVQNVINFQDYVMAKRVYNKTYKLKFGEIGIDGNHLDRLRKFILYRHRIVHVSPFLTPLSQPSELRKTADFPSRKLAHEAIEVFSQFISHLHEATLDLCTPTSTYYHKSVILDARPLG